MKAFCEKLSKIIRTVFGYGVMVSLFAGGLSFFLFVAATFVGGAEVNGSYAAKDPTVYTFDKDAKSLVATVVEDKFIFGNENSEDHTSLGTVENKDNGVVAHLYTINGEGNALLVDTPAVDTAYKFGIPGSDGKINYITGKMDGYRLATTSDLSEAIDVYLDLEKDEKDSYSFYTSTLDENGNVIEGKQTYINMTYSGGKGQEICTFASKKVLPVIIYLSVIMVLLGLIAMYLSGEKALTPEKKQATKHEGEM